MEVVLEPVPVKRASVARWIDRLKSNHAQEFENVDALRPLVEHALASAPMLMLRKNRYIERLILLRARLTPEQRNSPLVQGVMRRIMRNLDWSASYRLGFLEAQLVGRPICPDEPNVGPDFVPPNWNPLYPPDDDPNEGDDIHDFEI